MQIVIGLVGPIASGKGTISEYLKSQGFVYFSLSNVVREETQARGLEMTRENLQDVGNDLREKFGGAVLVNRLEERITKEDFVVIDGIRNPEEIYALKDDYQGKIVNISAYKNRRVERYLERAKIRGEDDASLSSFKKIDERDLGKGEDVHGQQVQACIDLADFTLENNTTIEQFHQNCQKMLDDFFFESHNMSFSQVALSLNSSLKSQKL
jgi:dephospho-CoA kinase